MKRKICMKRELKVIVLGMIAAFVILIILVQIMKSEPPVPSGPLNIEVPAAATTYSSVSVIWDKPEDYKDITGYNVYIDDILVGVRAVNETYYTAENLEPDTEYTITVKALTGKNESEESGKVKVKTDIKGMIRDVTQPPYNAKGDGMTLDTASIQKAIDDCSPNDIVLIPEGRIFLTGALDLKSGMTLEVNGTLLSSTNAEDFEKTYRDSDGVERKICTGGIAEGLIYTEEAPKRLVWGRSEGWEQYTYKSLINIGWLDEKTDYSVDESYVCSNVKIIGTGTITGDTYKEYYPPASNTATMLSINEGETASEFYDIENSETTENDIKRRIRGRLINISNAQNVYIKGVTVMNPPFWTVHMVYSDSVTTNGVDFRTDGYGNSDGWNPDSSTNCTIFDCDFRTGDDCIAIKSGKNPEGNIVNRPSKNIKILGCRGDGGNAALAIGSEISGGIDGVCMRDCVFSNTLYGIELKANKVRGGYIRNIDILDSTVDQILVHSVTYNADGEPADTIPVFSDMNFKNLNITGCQRGKDWLNTAIQLVGFMSDNGDNYYVKNVSFEDIVLGTKENIIQNVLMQYCRGVSFNNVKQFDSNLPIYAAEDAEFIIDSKKITYIVPKFSDVIEAERMNLNNFVGESNSSASGGGAIKLNGILAGNTAEAKAVYGGESGVKDICVTYFDGNAGVDTYMLYINDQQVDQWDTDKNFGSNLADERTYTNHITSDISVNQGDMIQLVITQKFKAAPDRFDRLEIGEADAFHEIEKQQLPNGISGSVDTAEKKYVWTIGRTETAVEAGTVYSDENDYIDLAVSLGVGDSMNGEISFSQASVREPDTTGQANVNDTKRYLLVQPKYDGVLSVIMAFPEATENGRERLYYADLGENINLKSIDLTLYFKSSHKVAGADIISPETAVRTINMEARHTYLLYTYQHAGTVYDISYMYIAPGPL